MISYFRNSVTLKEELLNIKFPPIACLFTADAVSMYTNIPTHTALNLISKCLLQHQQTKNLLYPINTVCKGLRLVMTQNIFTFGDLTFKQLNGTAMGTPPAPPYATVYFGIHEEKFVPCHLNNMILY